MGWFAYRGTNHAGEAVFGNIQATAQWDALAQLNAQGVMEVELEPILAPYEAAPSTTVPGLKPYESAPPTTVPRLKPYESAPPTTVPRLQRPAEGFRAGPTQEVPMERAGETNEMPVDAPKPPVPSNRTDELPPPDANQTQTIRRPWQELPTRQIPKVRRDEPGVRTTVPTLQPVRATPPPPPPAAPPPAPLRRTPSWRRWQPIPRTSLILYFDQLSVMLAAGLPLLRALEIGAEQESNDRLRSVLQQILRRVQEGVPLSRALELFPHVFSEMQVQAIVAAEESGALPGMLRRLARFEEARMQIVRSVQLALTYPVMVFGLVLLLVIGLGHFVFAQMLDMVSGPGVELPMLTQALVAVSSVLSNPLLWGTAIAAVGFAVASGKLPRRQLQAIWERVAMRNRFTRGLLCNMALASWTQSLAMLYDSGVPILRALRIAAQGTDSGVVNDASADLARRAEGGSPLADGMLAHVRVFPYPLIDLVAVGEETGKLPVTLEAAGRLLKQDVDSSLATVISLIEPLLMLVLGGIVACIVMGTFVPIYQVMLRQLGM